MSYNFQLKSLNKNPEKALQPLYTEMNPNSPVRFDLIFPGRFQRSYVKLLNYLTI